MIAPDININFHAKNTILCSISDSDVVLYGYTMIAAAVGFVAYFVGEMIQ